MTITSPTHLVNSQVAEVTEEYDVGVKALPILTDGADGILVPGRRGVTRTLVGAMLEVARTLELIKDMLEGVPGQGRQVLPGTILVQ